MYESKGPAELAAHPLLRRHGLVVRAQGRNDFTSYLVVDSCGATGLGATTTAASASASAVLAGGPADMAEQVQVQAAASAGSTSSAEEGGPVRFIVLRGVAWNAPETRPAELLKRLLDIWPLPLRGQPGACASSSGANSNSDNTAGAPAASGSRGGPVAPGPACGELLAHGGVLQLAWEVEPLLSPWVASSLDRGQRVVLSGYSLGGALAQALWAQEVLRQGQQVAAPWLPQAALGTRPGGEGPGWVLRLVVLCVVCLGGGRHGAGKGWCPGPGMWWGGEGG